MKDYAHEILEVSQIKARQIFDTIEANNREITVTPEEPDYEKIHPFFAYLPSDIIK